MSEAEDFEIRVGLRARALRSRTPPDARTETEGDVALAREQTQTGVPEEIEPGERYEDVTVEKRLSGQVGRRGGKSCRA